MVYGIIIHSPDNAEQLYFSTYYGIDNCDEKQRSIQQVIINKVIEEIKYYEEEKENSEHVKKNNKEQYLDLFGVIRSSKRVDNEVKIENEGFFCISDYSLFKDTVNVLWKTLNKICYTLILFTHENILLANHFLTIFINALKEHQDKKKKITKQNMNTFNPDTILATLYFFLPKGHLMLISHSYAKFLNNEVVNFIENKSQLKNNNHKHI
ncbi:AP-5 complex subunit sigma-1, putative [Hepatocystis sp. ex Piliocolobus tephrosceles]|nr:AP-5 complex subunit sigma-1, putative [Hepatocystis sp. ex Piliocolobus tephrosceles]